MRFRIKGIITLLTLLVTIVVSGGLSYWYFGGEVKAERDIQNTTPSGEGGSGKEEVFSDNILENYEFGNSKSLNETYTYYFFPSTLYNEIANDGQDPETAFGYNEVVLNDLNLPATNENGEVKYNIVTFGEDKSIIGLTKNEHKYTSYYNYLTDSLNFNTDYYLNSKLGSASKKDGVHSTKGDEYIIQQTEPYRTESERRYNNYYYYALKYSIYGSNINDPYIINDKRLGIISDCIAKFINTPVDEAIFDPEIFGDPEPEPIVVQEGGWIVGGWGYRDGIYRTVYTIQETYIEDVLENTSNGESEVYSPIYNNTHYDLGLDYDSRSPSFVEESEAPSPYGQMTEELDTDVNLFINQQSVGVFTKNANKNFGYQYQYQEQFQNRRQFRNDRFGFWTDFYDWDDPNNSSQKPANLTSGSRYLPIKITVNGNLSPDVLAEILPNVLASMFDRDGYFDATANIWTYNKYNSNHDISNSTYSKAKEGFTAKDIANIFDVMQSPKNYCDEENVVRLYPVFSNGKNYDNDNKQADPSLGGKDPIKAEFYYNDDVNDLDSLVTHKKLTYSNENGQLNGTSYTTYYLVLKNIYLEEGLYKKITISSCYTAGKFGYAGVWYPEFTIMGSQLDNFIKTYGEGLYTFYVPIGNAANMGSSSNLETFKNVATSIVDDSTVFKNLYGKNLIQCGKNIIGTDYYKNMIDGGSEIPGKTIALTIEKVTNLRLVSNIPIDEDKINEDGQITGTNNWGDIDSTIESGLLTAKNFVITDRNTVQTYNKNTNGMATNKANPSSPYIYLLQNADFRYVNNLYFQIRFSNKYIENALRIITDFTDYETDTTLNSFNKPSSYASVTIGGNSIEFASQRELIEDNESLFISNVEASSTDGVKRQGFKLRDYLARGVYDILLVSYGSITVKDADNNDKTVQLLNMYINRHRNSFIKVFDSNPGSFTLLNDENSTFISHKQSGDTLLPGYEPDTEDNSAYAKSALIWKGQAYLGDMLTSGSEGVDTYGTLLKALSSHFLSKEAGTYRLMDAVTGKAIAFLIKRPDSTIDFFNSNGSASDVNTIQMFQVLKNYVLYFEKV